MAHYAYITSDNKIHNIIVVANENAPTEEQGIQFLNELDLYPELEGKWIQTSYNTRMGIHYSNDGLPDDGKAIRKNFAGLDVTYDSVRDAFILNNKQFPSWVINEDKGMYEPPVPYPNTKRLHRWDEDSLSWIIAELPQPFPSWIKDEETGKWNAPIAMPNDGKVYEWNEDDIKWKLLAE